MRTSILIGILLTSGAVSAASGFNVMRMPPGKDVTLPYPAQVDIPLHARVTLSATDKPQSVKMISRGSKSIKVALYDAQMERVKYLVVTSKMPYIYTFQGLSSIMIIPQPAQGSRIKGKKALLRVESDKSLNIAR
ncbi:MAG: hypothetical protein OYH77_00805 [Pseudomonadota bacterium]|nr:hypothetical protein [Pseudomonadota bacterium]